MFLSVLVVLATTVLFAGFLGVMMEFLVKPAQFSRTSENEP